MPQVWENFELECLRFLREKYPNYVFSKKGGVNSTTSDIYVEKNGSPYFIEVKMPNAQSGQFVVIFDEESNTFKFSDKNKTQENAYTDEIIRYMNIEFEKFRNAGTKGEEILIDTKIFINWIIDNYKEKNVKYFITKKDDKFILIPIDDFGKYFNVKAIYRVKKSGSSSVPMNKISIVQKYLTDMKIKNEIKENKLFVNNYNNTPFYFNIENNDYYIPNNTERSKEVRKLSRTNNANVIFEISLK